MEKPIEQYNALNITDDFCRIVGLTESRIEAAIESAKRAGNELRVIAMNDRLTAIRSAWDAFVAGHTMATVAEFDN
ncbi:MAG TPA: hypothetical protein VKT73_13065 [Xanthobacteraceae bacterium]|nr:hypothetical protein [Xanthobacteraceae bacterium]